MPEFGGRETYHMPSLRDYRRLVVTANQICPKSDTLATNHLPVRAFRGSSLDLLHDRNNLRPQLIDPGDRRF